MFRPTDIAAGIRFGWASLIVAIVICGADCFAAAPAKGSAKEIEEVLQRIPPTEPRESLKTFRLEAGLAVELAAAEPQVSDPVDIAFDENGRMYVCEIWNYPGEPKAGEPLGRIRLLESSRGDGVYDKSTIFADDVKWPGGVFPWDGGVFVLSSPDVWYFKDTRGTGKADVREKVFTGMSGKTYEIANSLRWGLENRIYLSGSYAGGQLRAADEKVKSANIRSRDFRFDPRNRTIEAVSGGGEFGQTFDDWGDRFTGDATHFVWHPILPRDELARNPFLGVASVQEVCIPQWTRIFPISQGEPWKVAREKFWARWVNSNADMRAGRFPATELAPHGYATSAAGITIYRGSALGAKYLGDAFIGEPANNVVVRLKLKADGVSVLAARPQADADGKREFLASTDNWFRPVNFANGPDGCLYVVAMYREVIEDESAIPNDILKHYDLHSGRERGRILRIVPEKFQRPAMPRLAEASLAQLVGALDHADAWWRETAQRLIYQRQDKNAVPPLKKLAAEAKTPQGRIHALWSLEGLEALDQGVLLQALGDGDAHVREHAIRLAEPFIAQSADLQKSVMALAEDGEARVRFRAAFALGRVNDSAALGALAKIARHDVDDRWVRTAVLAAVAERSGALLELLAKDEQFIRGENAAAFLGELAQIVGARNDAAETGRLLAAIAGPAFESQPALRKVIIRQLGDGLAKGGSSLGQYLSRGGKPAGEAVALLFGQALKTAQDAKKPEAQRIEAIGLLAYAPYAQTGAALSELIAPAQPLGVQLAAVRALAGQSEPEVAEVLIAHWRGAGPSIRPDMIEALFRRPERLKSVIDAIERKEILPGDLEPRRRQALLESADKSVQARAKKLLAQGAQRGKEETLARYQQEIQKLTGDAGKGEQVFKNNCAACHRPEQGVRAGPNLATLDNRTPDVLLVSILDPNREVKPSFVGYEIVSRDGQEFSGAISNETATNITLNQAGGAEQVILRNNIQSMRSSGLSLMPEGFEMTIDTQAMADLLRFLGEMKE